MTRLLIMSAIAHLGFVINTPAQVSLRCYNPSKNKQQWSIGIRTGLSKEYHNSFYSSTDESKLLSWSQQLFLQRKLNQRFQLELQVLHQTATHDQTGFIGYPGISQVIASTYNERLQSNLLLHYIFKGVNKGTLSLAAGLGLIGSRQQYKESYKQLGQTITNQNINYNLAGPNLVGAITYSISLKKKFNLNSQLSYSNVQINTSVSHINLGIGLEYIL